MRVECFLCLSKYLQKKHDLIYRNTVLVIINLYHYMSKVFQFQRGFYGKKKFWQFKKEEDQQEKGVDTQNIAPSPDISEKPPETPKKKPLIFRRLTILIVTMEIKNKFTPDPQIKLMDQVRQILRYHHYSMSTEKTHSDCN